MTNKAFPFRHTKTRTIITGSTRLVVQAAIEKGLSLEVILWDGVIVQRIADISVEQVQKRVRSLSSNRYFQWSEEEWNVKGFTLTKKKLSMLPSYRYDGKRWKWIPVLIQQSKAL